MFGSVKTCHQDAEKSTPQETEGLASEIQHCQVCITQHRLDLDSIYHYSDQFRDAAYLNFLGRSLPLFWSDLS